MYKQLGTVLGVDFEMYSYPVDGFQLTLRDSDGDVLFDGRMIMYTLWEAICAAVVDVWSSDTDYDDELPSRVAAALGIEPSYDDEEEI